MIILDINLHDRYQQDFLGAREWAQNFKIFCERHVPLSRRRRNLYLLSVKTSASVGANFAVMFLITKVNLMI